MIKKNGIGWGWPGGIEKCDKLKMITHKKSKYFMFYVIVCCYMMWSPIQYVPSLINIDGIDHNQLSVEIVI